MLSTLQPQRDSQTGDYYGVIYKGSLIMPVLIMLTAAVLIWWVLRKHRN